MITDKEISLSKIANTIRHLTMDAVELAGSGHPGLPMGCAEIGAYLFGEFLRFDPAHPKWPLRDRLILSAGHGSLWLYSCLHMAGFLRWTQLAGQLFRSKLFASRFVSSFF